MNSRPNSEWLRAFIQESPARNRRCVSFPNSMASSVERTSRDALTGTRLATMKSMNSATPAVFAPGVSSSGMIISARCSTILNCWGEKKSGL